MKVPFCCEQCFEIQSIERFRLGDIALSGRMVGAK